MNGLGKFLEKNPIQKIKKKITSKIQKTTSEKANFCSDTIFSIQFKLE